VYRFDSPGLRGWRVATILSLIVGCAQLLAALNPDLTPLDSEELYNAAHARLLQLEHLDAFQRLQYRSYCGGCTVNALLGAGVFAMLGSSLLAWKLVPTLFIVTAVWFGTKALHDHSGPLGATLFAGLFALPPSTWQALSLVGWGNHMEAGCIAVVAACLLHALVKQPSTSRALGLGGVIALGMWIGFSSGFVPLAVALVLARRRAWKSLGLVVLAALPVVAIWALQSQTTSMSFLDPVYYPGERIPDVRRIPEKLWSLLAPRQLVALFGSPEGPLGWLGGWTWAGVAAWALLYAGRSSSLLRTTATFVLSFLGIYCVVRFTVWAPPSPEIAPPGSMRYAAPLYPLLFLLIAGGLAEAWREGKRRTAFLLLLPPLIVGLQSRIEAFSSPFPSLAALSMEAADMRYLRDQASYRLTSIEHTDCRTDDHAAQTVHAYGLGWTDAQDALNDDAGLPLPRLIAPDDRPQRAYFEAVGAAVWTRIDPHDTADISILSRALELLGNQTPDAQRTALAEIAWRRSHVWLANLRGGDPHGRALLVAINAAAEKLPSPADDALRYAMGRRWALDLARWAKPQDIALPHSPVPGPGFLEGMAYGLGTQWGSLAPIDQWWPPRTPPSPAARRAHKQALRDHWLAD